MRAVIGAVAGVVTGVCAWIVKDCGAGVFVGTLVAVTVWFWAWGELPGGRRG